MSPLRRFQLTYGDECLDQIGDEGHDAGLARPDLRDQPRGVIEVRTCGSSVPERELEQPERGGDTRLYEHVAELVGEPEPVCAKRPRRSRVAAKRRQQRERVMAFRLLSLVVDLACKLGRLVGELLRPLPVAGENLDLRQVHEEVGQACVGAATTLGSEHLERAFPLAIGVRAFPCGVYESVVDHAARSSLKVLQSRQSAFLQFRPVMRLQRCPVGNDPGFHAGRHEEYLVIGGSPWLFPAIALLKVFPGLLDVRHGVFTVDEHRHVLVLAFRPVGGLEVIEHGFSATAGH